MENKKTVNITPILEQVLGVSKINTKEDLQLLIKALREIGDREISKISPKEMAKIMESIKNKNAEKFEEKDGKSNIDIGQATIDALRSANGTKELDV